MTATQRYVGKNVYVAFETGGTTYVLSGDQNTVSFGEEANSADLTAGADDYVFNKPTTKQMVLSGTSFHTGSNGTATWGQVKVGDEGTIVFAPQGTASGNPRGGFPACVQNKNLDAPYADGVTRQFAFQQQGGVFGTSVYHPDTHVFS